MRLISYTLLRVGIFIKSTVQAGGDRRTAAKLLVNLNLQPFPTLRGVRLAIRQNSVTRNRYKKRTLNQWIQCHLQSPYNVMPAFLSNKTLKSRAIIPRRSRTTAPEN